MTMWIPLVVAALSIVGASFTYAYQRSIDRRDKLREKKQQVYETFLHALANVVAELRKASADSSAHDRFQLAKLSVFLVAPDEVVERVGLYTQLVEDPNGLPAERRTAFAKMIQAMRADTFEKSKLTSDQISYLAPINHPDPSASILSGRTQ